MTKCSFCALPLLLALADAWSMRWSDCVVIALALRCLRRGLLVARRSGGSAGRFPRCRRLVAGIGFGFHGASRARTLALALVARWLSARLTAFVGRHRRLGVGRRAVLRVAGRGIQLAVLVMRGHSLVSSVRSRRPVCGSAGWFIRARVP